MICSHCLKPKHVVWVLVFLFSRIMSHNSRIFYVPFCCTVIYLELAQCSGYSAGDHLSQEVLCQGLTWMGNCLTECSLYCRLLDGDLYISVVYFIFCRIDFILYKYTLIFTDNASQKDQRFTVFYILKRLTSCLLLATMHTHIVWRTSYGSTYNCNS